MEESCLTIARTSADSTVFLDLPTEVLANQILKFLCFTKAVNTLSFVCKRFDHALQVANFQKQIRVDVSNTQHLRFAPKVLSKYQVDTLILKSPGGSLSTLSTILKSLPRLHTLVICEIPDNKIGFIDLDSTESIANSTTLTIDPLSEHIITLSIPAQSLSLVQLFPQVSQLKLTGTYVRATKSCFPSIKELEINTCTAQDLTLIKDVFPALRIVYLLPAGPNESSSEESEEESAENSNESNEENNAEINEDGNESKKESDDVSKNSEEDLDQFCDRLEDIGRSIDIDVRCRFNHFRKDTGFDLSALSYHEYFNAFGCTPLRVSIKYPGLKDKVEEFLTLTSGEYERSFFTRDPLFRFPLLSPTFAFDISIIAFYKPRDPDVFQTFIDMGLANFWELLERDPEQATRRFHELYVKPPHYSGQNPGQALLKLFQRLPINQVLAKMGKEDMKISLNLGSRLGSGFLEAYAESTTTLDLFPIADLIDWNTENNNGINAATVAFQSENYEKWLELLEYGCSAQTEEYYPVESFVMSDFYSTRHKEIYDLIGTKAFLLRVAAEDMDEKSIEVIDRLIEYGEDMYQCNSFGVSFLQCIVDLEPSCTGNAVLKRLLTKHKIDVNRVSDAGRPTLIAAIDFEKWDKLDLLLMHGADPHFGGNDLSPLFFLCKEVQSGDFIRAIRILLHYGADINRLDYDEFGNKIPPLAMAIMWHQPLSHIEFMIERGARTDFIDENGGNLMHYTLLTKQVDHAIRCIRFFSKYCDINKQDDYGKTPLLTSLGDEYNLEICNALIEGGADVNTPSRTGTPLTWAICHNPGMIQHLLKHNIDIRTKDVFGNTCFCSVRGSTAEAIFSVLNENEFQQTLAKYLTPDNINFAIREWKKCFTEPNSTINLLNLERFFTYHVSFTKYLIEVIGVDPNWTDEDGDNLLCAINFESGRSEEVMEYLVSKGLDINHKNHRGETALYVASRNNSGDYEDLKLIQWLIKHGADTMIKDNLGISPADLLPNWQNFLNDGEVRLTGMSRTKKIDLVEIRKSGRALPQKRQKISPVNRHQ